MYKQCGVGQNDQYLNGLTLSFLAARFRIVLQKRKSLFAQNPFTADTLKTGLDRKLSPQSTIRNNSQHGRLGI
jgi:hypothetical protein